jgi:hypothetical protein
MDFGEFALFPEYDLSDPFSSFINVFNDFKDIWSAHQPPDISSLSNSGPVGQACISLDFSPGDLAILNRAALVQFGTTGILGQAITLRKIIKYVQTKRSLFMLLQNMLGGRWPPLPREESQAAVRFFCQSVNALTAKCESECRVSIQESQPTMSTWAPKTPGFNDRVARYAIEHFRTRSVPPEEHKQLAKELQIQPWHLRLLVSNKWKRLDQMLAGGSTPRWVPPDIQPEALAQLISSDPT